MFWKVLKDGREMFRPVSAQSEGDARRRVMAALGMELEGVSGDEFARMEARSIGTGGLPAISEACEPGEAPHEDAPCAGGGIDACPLREKCPRWLQNVRAWAVRP